MFVLRLKSKQYVFVSYSDEQNRESETKNRTGSAFVLRNSNSELRNFAEFFLQIVAKCVLIRAQIAQTSWWAIFSYLKVSFIDK